MARKNTVSAQPTPASVIPSGEHVVVDRGFNLIHTGTHTECAVALKVAKNSGLKMMTADAYQAEYARLATRNSPPPALVSAEPIVAAPTFTPEQLTDALSVLKDAGYADWSDAYNRIVANAERGLTANEVKFVLTHAARVRAKAVSPRVTGLWEAVRAGKILKIGTWNEITEICKTDSKIAMRANHGS